MFLMYTSTKSRANCWSKYINWSVSDNLTISSTRKVKQGCGLYMHTIEIMPGHNKILYGIVKIQGPKNKRIITACKSASKSKTVGVCLRVGKKVQLSSHNSLSYREGEMVNLKIDDGNAVLVKVEHPKHKISQHYQHQDQDMQPLWQSRDYTNTFENDMLRRHFSHFCLKS